MQATHSTHLIGVNTVDDNTCAEEQTSLEHSVGEEVEHTSEVAETTMLVMIELKGCTCSEGNHHECNLRDCRECKTTLDIALGTCNCSGIECSECTYHNDD